MKEQVNGLHLGFDTATPYLAMALWEEPGVGLLARRIERVDRGHAARFISLLEETLADAGVERSRLTRICCGVGPGSYTGLRVGGAAALGLARSLDLPLAGCDTLAAMAAGSLEDGEEGLAALDARRGNIYVGRYRREGNEVITLQAPRKLQRTLVLSEFPRMRLVEEVAPDPGYIARRASASTPYRPVYL